MSTTARTACLTADLSTAVDIFTEEITADSSNYVCYGNRSIVLARQCQWDAALEDANQCLSIKRSSIDYMSKGIALCGKGQIREACSAFDLASKMTTGNSASRHHIFLIKAIATFNANEQDEAIMCVNDMADVSEDANLLSCNVVQTYFYAQMGLTALSGNILDKAVEHITAAVDIVTSCSLQTMDLSVYAEFGVIFGWELDSLWQTVNKCNCLILLRAGRVEALECYLALVTACDEDQRASLRDWFARMEGVWSQPHRQR
ncbi:hypothetical protein BDR05DRAFT_952268 [Suillus weaverae]|nr:hypothetical protein BDR05DRAFT_952268 [Suillus weaverae]